MIYLHVFGGKVKRYAGFCIYAILQVSQETEQRVYNGHATHAHVQHTENSQKMSRRLHVILQRHHL